MAVSPKSLANLRKWKPGQSGNPGGKPVGSRNRLQGDFFAGLAADFHEHGQAAIVKVREEEPGVYLKIVASLMPKEFEAKGPLDDLDDDQLAAMIETVRAIVKAQELQPA